MAVIKIMLVFDTAYHPANFTITPEVFFTVIGNTTDFEFFLNVVVIVTSTVTCIGKLIAPPFLSKSTVP